VRNRWNYNFLEKSQKKYIPEKKKYPIKKNPRKIYPRKEKISQKKHPKIQAKIGQNTTNRTLTAKTTRMNQQNHKRRNPNQPKNSCRRTTGVLSMEL
jgi:hypothetical protein